ncbi:MAG: uncharacterized protein JWP01_3169 [Myxococcales bacterium]|nr:uncharacterized protein [Myxococcales bacterium]
MRMSWIALVVVAMTTAPSPRVAWADRSTDHDDEHDDDSDDARDARDGGFGREDPGGPIGTMRVVGPPIAEVLEAAYTTAGLQGRLGGGFATRARLGGLVPWVSVRTGRDTSWHDDVPDVGRGTTIEVRATWRLDRIVFDGRELQVAALEAARRRERRRLANLVIHTYFVWRRAASAGSSPRSLSRADEAAAELDALTNGWFSEARDAVRPSTGQYGPHVATP